MQQKGRKQAAQCSSLILTIRPSECPSFPEAEFHLPSLAHTFTSSETICHHEKAGSESSGS